MTYHTREEIEYSEAKRTEQNRAEQSRVERFDQQGYASPTLSSADICQGLLQKTIT